MKLDDTPLDRIPAARSGARDYERVARAIEYLRRNAAGQPDLVAAARHVHLSEHHFQRLFTRWAGVSPKRFVQFLTLEHAKARLATTRGVLDLAGAVGLSGPGRLHDLFVTLEAVSPGEYKASGAGLVIRYGVHESPFGAALVAMTPRGLCGLHFVGDAAAGAGRLRRDWPGAELRQDPAATAPVAERIFRPLSSQQGRALALLVKGTNFQVKVWRALLELPIGSLATYGDVAARIGAPGSARAVGTAIGANPVAWLIPCHRVIRESGALGGYRWGTERKAAMLAWEAAHAADPAA
ncbi:MAG TPA: methylated-DNA--[protein]-cysteine S-methyltransferase [Burkholderiales bacterium]|jgi:AraC family transcriptional regulator of adaptative response/methylated-DNA-[protein]-cysteine methyltransferase